MSKKGKKQVSVYEKITNQREHIYKKGTLPIIGFDIGSSYIKVVKMKRNNKIVKLAIEPIPEGVITQGRIEAEEPLVNILKTVRRKHHISGKDCALCISGSEIIVRELTVPDMTEEQIIDNIRHEIGSFLPLKFEDYSIDYKILEYIKDDNDTIGKLKLLVGAVPNRQARAYVDALKKANFRLKYIDVTPNIDSKLARWIMHAIGKDELKDIAIIDFGSQSVDVSVLHQGSYCLHKSISNGGDYLTSIIAEKAEIDPRDAEEIKYNTDFFNTRKDDVLTQNVMNYFDYLINDIERILDFYKNRNNHKGIDQIYIMGGGSFQKGIAGYIERRLGVKVFPLSEALEMFRGGRNQTEHLAMLFNAIGATMREEA